MGTRHCIWRHKLLLCIKISQPAGALNLKLFFLPNSFIIITCYHRSSFLLISGHFYTPASYPPTAATSTTITCSSHSPSSSGSSPLLQTGIRAKRETIFCAMARLIRPDQVGQVGGEEENSLYTLQTFFI